MLKDLKGKKAEKISLKYQVLCKETAMVGSIKQREKATGTLLEY